MLPQGKSEFMSPCNMQHVSSIHVLKMKRKTHLMYANLVVDNILKISNDFATPIRSKLLNDNILSILP